MRLIVVSLILFLSAPAFAVPVTWTIQDGLAGATAMSGSFVFDADESVNPYTDIDIYIALGSGYALNDANLDGSSDASTLILDLAGLATFEHVYVFDSPLTNAGGTIAFTGYIFTDDPDVCGGFSVCADLSGQVMANVVPIPAAVWLFASGLTALGWFRRRKFH